MYTASAAVDVAAPAAARFCASWSVAITGEPNTVPTKPVSLPASASPTSDTSVKPVASIN